MFGMLLIISMNLSYFRLISMLFLLDLEAYDMSKNKNLIFIV